MACLLRVSYRYDCLFFAALWCGRCKQCWVVFILVIRGPIIFGTRVLCGSVWIKKRCLPSAKKTQYLLLNNQGSNCPCHLGCHKPVPAANPLACVMLLTPGGGKVPEPKNKLPVELFAIDLLSYPYVVNIPIPEYWLSFQQMERCKLALNSCLAVTQRLFY